MIKPVVHYSGPISIREWLHSEPNNIEYIAYLPEVLDHPNLGRCSQVRTSGIVKFPDKSGTFETRNTIYEKATVNPASEFGLVNESY